MVGCKVDVNWSYRGFNTIIMENENLRLSILVDYGAKVFELIDKSISHDFLYHNPRVEPRVPVYGVNVDNWWCGGIDEAIPTGHPCYYKGENYPYLGEVWSLPWNYKIEKDETDEVVVHLWRTTVIAPLRVDRWITLKQNKRIVYMHHKITNIGYSKQEFIWGIHPSFYIEPGYRIELPAGNVMVHESLPNDRLGSKGTKYVWPYAVDKNGNKVDMREVPPPTVQTSDLHYAIQLKEGWFALIDPKNRRAIGMCFPKEIFKAVWLWLVYGGWRGLYCAAIEPWTGYPARLDEAVREGVYSELSPNESLECDTRIVIFHKFSDIEEIKNNLRS